jgi:hypothetical protein
VRLFVLRPVADLDLSQSLGVAEKGSLYSTLTRVIYYFASLILLLYNLCGRITDNLNQ